MADRPRDPYSDDSYDSVPGTYGRRVPAMEPADESSMELRRRSIYEELDREPPPARDGWLVYGGGVDEAEPQRPPPAQPPPPPPAPAPRRRGGWRAFVAALAVLVVAAALTLTAFAVGRQTAAAQEESEPVEIPVVRGQSISDVNNVLQQLGLSTVFTAPVFDDQIPLNSVISTSPPARTTVRTGDVVTITFSSGAQPISVPPLIGQPEDLARAALEESGLTPGLRLEQPSTDVAAGSVMRLEPGVGTQVPAGLPVTLVVSSGPPPLVVPRVIGLTESEASQQLSDAGLRVTVERRFSDRLDAGRILDQQPAGGTVAGPGSEIILFVSLGN